MNKVLLYISACLVIVACDEKVQKTEVNQNAVFYPKPKVEEDASEPIDSEKYQSGDFSRWYNSNKYKLSTQSSFKDVSFGLLYKPTHVMVEQDYDTVSSIAAIDSLLPDYDGMQYYILTIGLNQKRGDLLKYTEKLDEAYTYEALVKYFSFKIQENLSLQDGDRTIPCSIIHFERTFGARPFCNIIVGFERLPNHFATDKTLIYKDQVYGLGIVKLKLDKQVFINMPADIKGKTDELPIES